MELAFTDRRIYRQLSSLFAFFCGFFIIGVVLWTRKFFGYVTIDQAISTVYFGLEGAFAADSIFLKRFIEWCLLGPVGMACLLQVIKNVQWHYLQKAKKNRWHTIIYYSKKLNQPRLFVCMGIILFINQFHIITYLRNNTTYSRTDYFQQNYVDPKLVKLQLKQAKSLVLIYVESLESTYSNTAIFGHDLLQPLKQWQKQGTSFAEYQQMPGTGWTIAGIVATQCSVPLKQLTIFNGNRFGENISRFLPKAKCLGDILAEYGYHNIFINGSSTLLGGKIQFFKDHHYHDIYGKSEWIKQGFSETNFTSWGLSDHDLFEQAKQIMAKEIASKKHFNLTILTVDTHGYQGQLNKYCRQQGYHGYEGIVECTAATISNFISYIKENGWLKQVNVIVIGDHLAMQNPLSAKLNSAPRSIFNLFISEQQIKKKSDKIMSFSLLPTILKFIGFDFKSNKLGLGYSAIEWHGKAPPANYNLYLANNIDTYSPFYVSLWL